MLIMQLSQFLVQFLQLENMISIDGQGTPPGDLRQKVRGLSL